MKVSENICPVCTTANELDAIVCGHCGAALDDPSLDPEHYSKTTSMQAVTPEKIRKWALNEAPVVEAPDHGIAFHIEGYSRPAHIDSPGEFILGRRIDATSELLLDLSPFGAYSLGLSKRHAIIRRRGNGYEVMDLGSFNGTWLNEKKLTPQTPYALPSGSHLRLGRMQIIVLYRPIAGTD